jgi:tetratricopeptide (TPR) repeat protein
MSSQVLRRFIILMAIATFAVFTVSMVVRQFAEAPPGDFHVRQGDQRLNERKYDEALAAFDAALKRAPHHRGAMMGRAIVFLETDQLAEAEVAFTDMIDFLTHHLEPDDATGIAVLAGAYANRGILYDRTGRHEKALSDYLEALRIDEGAVKGPGIVHRILFGNSRPSTVRKRAEYIAHQLTLPEQERVLLYPERDAAQRRFRP